MSKIVSSPYERVVETVKTAYNEDSNEKINTLNQSTNTKKNEIRVSLYENLFSFGTKQRQSILQEFDPQVKNIMKEQNIPELQAQDIVVEKFLKGEFVNGNPYDVSRYQLQLINKMFTSLDKRVLLELLEGDMGIESDQI